MDQAIVIALIVALAPTLAIVVQSRINKKNAVNQAEKIQEIHVLVNSRLHEALQEISNLKDEISDLKGKDDAP